MRKFNFTITLLAIFSMSQAQSWEWAIHENVKKFAVDSSGTVFSYSDSTIKKINSDGILQWQKEFKGDLVITGMVADNSGSLYIVGRFTDFSIDTNHFTSTGNKDIFFCKIDTAGTILWNKIVGGPNDDYVTDLYLNKQKKILICGNVAPGAVIGSTLFSEAEFFTARYDLNGNLELLFNRPGGGAWEVSAGPEGNIYLLGRININETLDFGNGLILYGYPGSDPFGSHFIAKFNAAGNILWAKDLGSNYYTPFKNLAIDNTGDFYLAKWQRYQGFDLNKFDSSGNLIRNHNIGGTYGDCYSLCIDNTDFIWMTGYIWNGDFNGQPFIWEIDPSNNLTGTTPAAIAANGNNIASDYNNNIYVSGTFNDTAVFGNTILLASAGTYFLAKMSRNSGTVTSANNMLETAAVMTIFPNPTTGIIEIKNLNDKRLKKTIMVYDVTGKCVYENLIISPTNSLSIDLSKQPKGVYFIELLGNKKSRQRIIVQ